MNKIPINVTIKSKENIIFEGVANTVTSKNDQGVFDILPFHTNFITLIKDYVVLNKGESSENKFDIKKGVLYVMSNDVNVYVGI